MDRSGLVRWLVLSEISDDYENVDQVILPNVAKDAAKCGLAIERSEIVEALSGLVRDGLAKAYILSPWGPFSSELPNMPRLDVVEESFETYFYVTKAGVDLLVSDDTWWPFDDDDKLRSDWRLDSI